MTKKPRKPNNRGESILLAAVRLAVGARSDFRALRINVGLYRAPHSDHRVRSAPTGTADLLGIWKRKLLIKRTINPDGFNPVVREDLQDIGQFIAIETKFGRDGRLSKEQEAFRDMVLNLGGIYIEARSVADVLDILGPDPAAEEEEPPPPKRRK